MKKALSLLSFAIAAGLDLWSLDGFVRGSSSVASMALIRITAALFALAGLFLCVAATGKSKRLTLAALGLGFTLPAPLLGTVALAVMALVLTRKPAEDLASGYVFGETQVLTEIPYAPAGEFAPASVLHVLNRTSGEARRNAILSLRTVEPRRALPVLRKAIQDSDEQVRLLAQTQFNRTVGALESAIKKMEAELSDGLGGAPALVRLAEQYHELVHLGISSAETETIYLDRAAELAGSALKLAPERTDALFLLLKCQIKRGQIAEAEETITRLRAQHVAPHRLVPWEAEARFLRRDWAGVVEMLKPTRGLPESDPRLRTLVDLWSA